jgi:hypothetical protein
MLRIKNYSALAQGAGLTVFGLAVAGAAITCWLLWQHHFWTARKGPTEVTLAELAKIERPDQLPSTWIKVTFQKAHDTKLKVEEVEGGRTTIIEKYLLVPIDDRWMIAVVPATFHGNVLSGQIWDANSQVNNEAFVAIHKELQDLHGERLLPLVFHAEANYGENWTYFAAAMAMFGATGVFFSFLGAGGVYRGLFGPAPVTEAELNEKASAQVDDAIARIFQSAGTPRR